MMKISVMVKMIMVGGGHGPEKDDIMLMVWTGDQHHLGGGEENLLKIQQLELWVGNTTCHHHFKSSS